MSITRSDRPLIFAIFASFLLRIVICACSVGTNDTLSFLRFAKSIDRHGILATYHTDSEFNHPPIPAYWAWLAMRLTQPSKYAFAILFRVPPILADVGTVWLLCRAGRARFGNLRPLASAALFAWCPAAILISAHHANTDSIYAFLCLLSVFLMEKQNSAFFSGLALAAAINIKLIPVLLIAPLLLSMRSWSDAGRFVAGLSLGIIPFLGPLLWARADFVHNVIAYPSSYNLWGVNFFLSPFVPNPNKLPRIILIYRDVGRILIVTLVLAWSVAARVIGRWNRYDVAAGALAIFMVFTPGIGIQYLVILLPLLFAVRPALAAAYGLCAGAYVLAAYQFVWDGWFPVASLFHSIFPPRVGWIGLLAWGELVCYLIVLWQPPQPANTQAVSRAPPLIHVRNWLLFAILLSFGLRVGLSACSWGTTDAVSFNRFAQSILRVGLLGTYRADSEFNHPPLPGYWSWLALRLTRGLPFATAFPFVFRVPMILADAGTVWLLSKIAPRQPGLSPLQVAALFACCPVAILISAYHGNTDSIYAFLCLLCVYLLDADRAFLAGLALAAAINVKLIPILLIVPLLLSMRKWSDATKFTAGLLLGILPFLVPLIGAPESFVRNALAYASRFDLWGLNLFLSGAADDTSNLPHAVVVYQRVGRFLIIALVLAWSILARRKRTNRYDIAAGTFAIFLVFAPGFGVQYLVIILPLLFAARPRLATLYGLLAGTFLLTAYAIFWDGGFPLSSLFNRTFPPILGYIGVPAWCALVYYLTTLMVSTTEAKKLT